MPRPCHPGQDSPCCSRRWPDRPPPRASSATGARFPDSRSGPSLEAADLAAAELGVSRRQVYALVRRWRAGEGLASDLLPRHLRWRSGWRAAPGRGGDRGAGSSADAVPDAAAANGGCGVPGGRAGVQGSRSAGAVAGNGAASHRQARPGAGGLGQGGRRRGQDAAPGRRDTSGDHRAAGAGTSRSHPVDVIVVDERHRAPAGRLYVTVAIDVASRCVAGLVVTLEAWSRQVSLRAPEWRGRVNRALRIDPRSLHSVEYTDRP